MHRASWILWLMLALLPLRGWAVASMGLPPAAAAVVFAATAEHEGATEAVMPACHEGSDDTGSASNCQACDWCHAAIGLASCGEPATVLRMADPPVPALVRDTGRRAVGGLDRPPRAVLA